MGVRTADITVERQAGGFGGGLGDGKRDAEDGVCTEARLVRRTVELDHHLVDLDLVFRVQPADRVEDLGIDGLDSALDTLAEITATAVTQFDSLVCAGRGARRDGRAAHAAVFEIDVDLDGRIAAAVQNFTADDVGDCSHERLPGAGWD